MDIPPPSRIWYRELGETPEGLRLVEARESPDHEEGAYVDGDPGDAPLVWRSSATPHGPLRVGIPFERVPDAPNLWFVASDEPRARTPACVLAAFAGDELPDGTIVTARGFALLGVSADAQLGEVRWFRDGLVHHIHVEPAYRRRDIGTSLVHVAGAWQQANRWPGFLHASGRRTRLAQLFLAPFGIPGRVDAGPLPPVE
jgi:GNAT superfamily N-acetyltransferase